MKVIVTTFNDYIDKAMRPFSFLFNHFWGNHQQVEVIGARPPVHKMPQNFTFTSVGDDWPMDEYTDKLIPIIRGWDENYFVWLLDDYFLNSSVDWKKLETLISYMKEHRKSEILRIDLTADRLKSGHAEDVGKWRRFDIIETKQCQYQMSLQAGLWDRRPLLDILQKGWSPWAVELEGTSWVNDKPTMRVMGTKQWPVSYTNALGMGNKGINLKGCPDELVKQMEEWGWFKRSENG